MITNPIKSVYYIGDGITTDFAYAYNGDAGFDVRAETEVRAAICNADGTRDYQPNFAVLQDTYGNLTGSVRFASAPAPKSIIFIYRETPETQETSYETSSGFSAKSVEKALDKLTQEIQDTNQHSVTKTLQLDMFQKKPFWLQLLDYTADRRYAFIDWASRTVKAGLIFEIKNGRFRVSEDGHVYKYIPESSQIEELRQVILENPRRYIYEYRIGSEWYQIHDASSGISHNELLERDAEDCHPISAITGLTGKLKDLTTVSNRADEQSKANATSIETLNGQVANHETRIKDIETTQANHGERIVAIESKIPTQATAENQLADRNFVNSSIQTQTANFRGNWPTYAAIPADSDQYPEDYSGSHTPTVNDYLIVEADETHNGETWRYKFTGNWMTEGKAGWMPEYRVNETPLTADQLAALNSGVTSSTVTQVKRNKTDIADLQEKKADADNVYTKDDVYTKTEVDGKETALQQEINKNAGDIAALEYDKLDKNQGVENAGHIMTVGADGNLYPASAETTQNIAPHNVGDTFFTTRAGVVNGAVERNGTQYNIQDVNGGNNNLQELLESGQLPYRSFAEWGEIVARDGGCDSFAWDGGDTFRVPLAAERRLVRRKEATEEDPTGFEVYSDGHCAQWGLLPPESIASNVQGKDLTIEWPIEMADTSYNAAYITIQGSFQGLTLHTRETTYGVFRQSNRASSTQTAQNMWRIEGQAAPSEYAADKWDYQDSQVQRPMIQLFNGVSDDAVSTVTQVLSDVAELKAQLAVLMGGRYLVRRKEPTEEDASWYDVFSDGKCRQGGSGSGSGNKGYPLEIKMRDTQYTKSISRLSGASTTSSTGVWFRNTSTEDSVVIYATSDTGYEYIIEGYADPSEYTPDKWNVVSAADSAYFRYLQNRLKKINGD